MRFFSASVFSLFFSIAASANCNIWVDKAQLTMSSHAVVRPVFWVKVARLDSKPVKVVFFSKILPTEHAVDFCKAYPNTPDCSYLDIWREYELERFFSEDYWKLSLIVSSDYNFSHVFEGIFYVQTESGRKYYAKSAVDNGHFYIDANMTRNLHHINGAQYRIDADRALVTRDKFPYLNPDLCG